MKEKKNTTLNLVKPSFDKELWDVMNSYLCTSHSVNPPYVAESENTELITHSTQKGIKEKIVATAKKRKQDKNKQVC